LPADKQEACQSQFGARFERAGAAAVGFLTPVGATRFFFVTNT